MRDGAAGPVVGDGEQGFERILFGRLGKLDQQGKGGPGVSPVGHGGATSVSRRRRTFPRLRYRLVFGRSHLRNGDNDGDQRVFFGADALPSARARAEAAFGLAESFFAAGLRLVAAARMAESVVRVVI